jgi:hypothetical protein
MEPGSVNGAIVARLRRQIVNDHLKGDCQVHDYSPLHGRRPKSTVGSVSSSPLDGTM